LDWARALLKRYPGFGHRFPIVKKLVLGRMENDIRLKTEAASDACDGKLESLTGTIGEMEEDSLPGHLLDSLHDAGSAIDTYTGEVSTLKDFLVEKIDDLGRVDETIYPEKEADREEVAIHDSVLINSSIIRNEITNVHEHMTAREAKPLGKSGLALISDLSSSVQSTQLLMHKARTVMQEARETIHAQDLELKVMDLMEDLGARDITIERQALELKDLRRRQEQLEALVSDLEREGWEDTDRVHWKVREGKKKETDDDEDLAHLLDTDHPDSDGPLDRISLRQGLVMVSVIVVVVASIMVFFYYNDLVTNDGPTGQYTSSTGGELIVNLEVGSISAFRPSYPGYRVDWNSCPDWNDAQDHLDETTPFLRLLDYGFSNYTDADINVTVVPGWPDRNRAYVHHETCLIDYANDDFRRLEMGDDAPPGLSEVALLEKAMEIMNGSLGAEGYHLVDSGPEPYVRDLSGEFPGMTHAFLFERRIGSPGVFPARATNGTNHSARIYHPNLGIHMTLHSNGTLHRLVHLDLRETMSGGTIPGTYHTLTGSQQLPSSQEMLGMLLDEPQWLETFHSTEPRMNTTMDDEPTPVLKGLEVTYGFPDPLAADRDIHPQWLITLGYEDDDRVFRMVYSSNDGGYLESL